MAPRPGPRWHRRESGVDSLTRLPFFEEAWIDAPDWAALWRHAEGQAGLFTTAEARAFGIRRSLISHHKRKGTLESVARGLHRIARWPAAPEDPIRIAWMIAGREPFFVSHESALFLHGLIESVPGEMDLTVPREDRWRIPPTEVQRERRIRVHAPRRGHADGEVTTARGIRCQAPRKALLEALRRGWVGKEDAARAWHGIESKGRLLDEIARLRGPGSAIAKRALRRAGD